MNVTGYEQRAQLLKWAESLAALVEPRDAGTAKSIRQAAVAYSEHRFVLTVLGKAKRGKSTLVNAILGRRDDELAPIDKLPTSSVLSRFISGESIQATVFYRSNAGAGTGQQAIDPNQIRQYVTEEENPNNRKLVDCVEVAGPFPGFDRDLVLIDTPGAGSIHEYHDQIVRAVIPQSDAVLFLVTARMPLDQDELALLRQLRDADVRKVFFAINRVDQSTAEELEQAESHNRALLQQVGIAVDRLHHISALRAYEGRTAESGLDPLLTEIRELLSDGKAKTLRERLTSRVRNAVAPLLQGLDAEISLSGQTAEERQQTRSELERQRLVLPAQRTQSERRFQSEWQHALDEFGVGVRAARGAVEQQLLDTIDQVSLSGLSALTKELSTRITESIEASVRPHALVAEAALQAACRELEATYPRLTWDSTGPLSGMRAGSQATATGAAVGTAVVVAGGGLIFAAQAAAVASVTYVTTPSLLGAALMFYTGTAANLVTTTAVPAAIPIWAAAAGPIGWTLIGLGALAVPVAWSLGRAKVKDQLRHQAQQQIERVYQFLLEERLPLIRNSSESILDEFRQRGDRELTELEAALVRAESCPLGVEHKQQLTATRNQLASLLATEVSSA